MAEGLDLLPLPDEPGDVALDLLGRDVLGGGAHDHAVVRGLDLVEDVAQALALLVGQALRDAVGLAVGHEHHEATGERHLLREPGALEADGVLRDLAEDDLLGLQHLLDLRLGAVVDVVGVVVHVAAVEHGVLGGADVDERGLHAGQHVLHPTEVDVAVDLADVVGGARHVVLEQRPALEHRDLRGLGSHVHGHEVATDRATVALTAAAGLEGVVVELHGRTAHHRGDRLGHAGAHPRGRSAAALRRAAAAGPVAAAVAARTAAGCCSRTCLRPSRTGPVRRAAGVAWRGCRRPGRCGPPRRRRHGRWGSRAGCRRSGACGARGPPPRPHAKGAPRWGGRAARRADGRRPQRQPGSTWHGCWNRPRSRSRTLRHGIRGDDGCGWRSSSWSRHEAGGHRLRGRRTCRARGARGAPRARPEGSRRPQPPVQARTPRRCRCCCGGRRRRGSRPGRLSRRGPRTVEGRLSAGLGCEILHAGSPSS